MKAFNRILLGMDLTNTDLYLLDYLRVLGGVHKPEKVYCTHVVKELDLPSFVRDEIGEMKIKPLDERLKKNLESELDLKLKPGEFDIDCNILEGKIRDQLLHWVEVKGVDLVILGRKIPALGSGISARRFLRKSPTSVLFVPHAHKTKIKKIVLATDFSKTSTYALLSTLEWMESMPNPVSLTLVHVYDIPSGVRAQLGNLPETITNRIRETTEEFSKHYLESLEIQDRGIEVKLIENEHINPGNYIYESARELDADLLVMGAYGHSFLGNLVLGSVSEKVLDLNKEIPLMILRPKPVDISKLPSFSIKSFKTLDYA